MHIPYMLLVAFLLFFLRFNDHWKYALQKLSFLSALVTYLKTEKLVSREETAAMIGGK